jgi:hypothetical protein
MSNPSAYGSMIAISSIWGNNKTFRMFPMDSNCPYLECIYDPETKILVVISKSNKQSYHMLPVLDDHGDEVPVKRPRRNNKTIREERRMLDTYQEYYIILNEEIYDFISKVAVNAETFDFKTFVEAPPVAPTGISPMVSMENPTKAN